MPDDPQPKPDDPQPEQTCDNARPNPEPEEDLEYEELLEGDFSSCAEEEELYYHLPLPLHAPAPAPDRRDILLGFAGCMGPEEGKRGQGQPASPCVVRKGRANCGAWIESKEVSAGARVTIITLLYMIKLLFIVLLLLLAMLKLQYLLLYKLASKFGERTLRSVRECCIRWANASFGERTLRSVTKRFVRWENASFGMRTLRSVGERCVR